MLNIYSNNLVLSFWYCISQKAFIFPKFPRGYRFWIWFKFCQSHALKTWIQNQVNCERGKACGIICANADRAEMVWPQSWYYFIRSNFLAMAAAPLANQLVSKSLRIYPSVCLLSSESSLQSPNNSGACLIIYNNPFLLKADTSESVLYNWILTGY